MAYTFAGTGTVGGQAGHVIPPYYSDFLRSNLYPSLFFRQLGTQVTIPRGSGMKVKIPRWQTPVKHSSGVANISGAALTAVNEQVTEGSTITAVGLSAQDITGQILQWAGAKGYNDKLILVTKANFIEGALEALARELSFKIDRYTRQSLTGSASLFTFSTTKNKTATTDVLVGKRIARIAPIMDGAGVPRFEDNTYVGLTTPLAQLDIFSDISSTGFVGVSQYGDPTRIYRGEVGQMYSVRWLFSAAIPRLYGTAALSASNGLSPAATGADAFVFSPDSFYSIELEGGGVEVIHHPPGSSGARWDPANQLGSIAVKCFYGVAPQPSGDGRVIRMAHGLSLHY